MEDKYYTDTYYSHVDNGENTLSPVWEDYLEMIYRLRNGTDNVIQPVRIRDLAEQLHVSPSSASRMAKAMALRGFLDFQRYGYITLTDKGEENGAYLLRRHEIVCSFLSKLRGGGGILAEAERIEHGLTPETVAALETWTRAHSASTPHHPTPPAASDETANNGAERVCDGEKPAEVSASPAEESGKIPPNRK